MFKHISLSGSGVFREKNFYMIPRADKISLYAFVIFNEPFRHIIFGIGFLVS